MWNKWLPRVHKSENTDLTSWLLQGGGTQRGQLPRMVDSLLRY